MESIHQGKLRQFLLPIPKHSAYEIKVKMAIPPNGIFLDSVFSSNAAIECVPWSLCLSA